MSSLMPIEPNQVVYIPLDQIEPDPNQPRRAINPAFLEQLAADIKARGVQQPITVRKPVINGDPYRIKYGEQRYEASRLAKLHTIPCILATAEKLTHDNDNRNLEILFDQIHENHERAPLNALDWAYTCKRMREEFGLKVNEIAQQCAARGLKHMSRPHISNLMRLTELPEWAQAAIRTNRIQAGHGKHLFAALHSPKVEEQIRKLIEDQADDPPSVRELQNLIDEAYTDNHRVAYELGWPGHERFFEDLGAIGVVEVNNTRYVLDQGKYEEARDQVKRERARPSGTSGDASGNDHDAEEDDHDNEESSAPDDERDERDITANPLWDEDGTVHEWERRRLIASSVQRYARDQLLAGPMDQEALAGIGAWRAYDLGMADEGMWSNVDNEDTFYNSGDQLSNALAEVAPELLDGDITAWTRMDTKRYFSVMATAGRLVVECSSPDLLSRFVRAYGITLEKYRIDKTYCQSLDREAFTALLNAPAFEGESLDLAAKSFDDQVNAVIELAWRFGIPESVQAMWDHLMTEEADADEHE